MSDYFSCLKGINEAKRRVNNMTSGDSSRVDAAEWTLKPDSHDEIPLAIFSHDVAQAAKAWTVAEVVEVDTENRKQNRTK
ncbi:unnamed protein product [Ixodes hexagonus]